MLNFLQFFRPYSNNKSNTMEEEERKINHRAAWLRNKAYWDELKNIQQECDVDSQKLLDAFTRKSKLYSCLAMSISDPNLLLQDTLPQSVRSNKGGSSDDSVQISSELYFGGNIKAMCNTSRNIGEAASSTITAVDMAWAAKYIAFVRYIDSKILGNFNTQLKAIESDTLFLWKRGENLFFALELANRRVQVIWTEMQSARSTVGAGTSLCKSRKDAWLVEMKYNVALTRYYQLFDECNVQFHQIFELSKSVEKRRIALIAQSTELFITKQQELWSQTTALCPLALSTMKDHAKASSEPTVSISEELAHRISSGRAEGSGHFSAIAAYEHGQSTKNTPLGDRTCASGGYVTSSDILLASCSEVAAKPIDNDSVEISKSSSAAATNLSPMLSPHIAKTAIFQLQNAGVLVTSWKYVLLVATKDEWVHIYPLQFYITSNPQMYARGKEAQAFNALVKSCISGVEHNVCTSKIDPLMSKSKTDCNKDLLELTQLREYRGSGEGTHRSSIHTSHSSGCGGDGSSAGSHGASEARLHMVEEYLKCEQFMTPEQSFSFDDIHEVSFKPSPESTENRLELTVTDHTAAASSSWNIFKSSEVCVVFKARSQQEAIDWTVFLERVIKNKNRLK